MNQLLPADIAATLPPLYSQEDVADPLVVVKFFHPMSHWTWYATEFDPLEGIFFGWVYGDFPELGYFSLAELEAVKDPLGLGIERDIHFTPTRLSEVKKWHEKSSLRQAPVMIYLIVDEEPDFTSVIVLAQRMARLLFAMNFHRATWISDLDENQMPDIASAAFDRIAVRITPLFDVRFLEMAKEVFIAVFTSQIAESLVDYFLKWYEQQQMHPPEERGNE